MAPPEHDRARSRHRATDRPPVRHRRDPSIDRRRALQQSPPRDEPQLPAHQIVRPQLQHNRPAPPQPAPPPPLQPFRPIQVFQRESSVERRRREEFLRRNGSLGMAYFPAHPPPPPPPLPRGHPHDACCGHFDLSTTAEKKVELLCSHINELTAQKEHYERKYLDKCKAVWDQGKKIEWYEERHRRMEAASRDERLARKREMNEWRAMQQKKDNERQQREEKRQKRRNDGEPVEQKTSITRSTSTPNIRYFHDELLPSHESRIRPVSLFL